MNNNEALAYIDRLWNKYGALFAAEKDTAEAELMQKYFEALGIAKDAIKVLEQKSQSFEWCDTCKEYDQEKHCCHRWSKAIRDTVEEMKQEYIEREVLDKIRAEIERQEKWLMDAGYNQYNVDIALYAIKSAVDKYKAETESEDGNNN